MKLRWAFLPAVALIGGCAIHPLPQDVTPFDTNAIVFHIRCEARTALKNATVEFLLNPAVRLSENTRREARSLRDGHTPFHRFDLSKIDPAAAFYLLKYENAAIAYDFTFDMAVGNIEDASIDLLGPVSNGTVSLGVGAGANRTRQTIRNFKVADTFGGLRKSTLCEERAVREKNFIYPITGTIGLDEFIKTFVDLNEFNNLTGEKAAVPVMADTFAFQTNLSGSVTPSLQLSSLGRFGLSKAAIPLSASRKDLHQVVIATSLDPKTWANLRVSSAGIFGIGASVPGQRRATSAKDEALIEIDKQKTINSLNNILIRPR